jgi:hypothetical protein
VQAPAGGARFHFRVGSLFNDATHRLESRRIGRA